MKNFIILSVSALIVQSSVASEGNMQNSFDPFNGITSETSPVLDINQLEKYTPELPRLLSPTELNAMFEEMKAMNKLSRSAFSKLLARVKYIQYSFEFTKESGVRRNRELRTYLIFTYRAIQADLSTDCEQYFHNAYEENKADFNRVMSTLSPTQRANLYKADDEAKRLQANPIQDDE